MIHREVCQYLSVEGDSLLVDFSHELRIRHFELSHACIDTLYPQGAETSLFIATVAVSIQLTFFPSILGYGPNIFTGKKITSR